MFNKFWRDSSTLILVYRNTLCSTNNSSFDYSLLMLKRSSKSKFMPNAYVFPGGVTDKHEFDKRWHELFNSCDIPSRPTTDLILKDVPRPLLLQGKMDDGMLEKDLAFRIGAIRETFEEAGILLHKPIGNSAEKLCSNTLLEWREKVRKNPSEFFNMCQQFSICPDVWSL